MSFRPTRRTFLRTTAATLALGPAIRVHAAPTVLRHAAVGVGGKGWSDMNIIASHPDARIVAICDVDLHRLDKAAKKHPGAKRYDDWRELLDRQADTIDSMSVSTPDHMHAPITMSALNLGKHVYCQKPLTHDVYEARKIADAARRRKLSTQMGIQGHASIENRMAVHLIRQGVIGPVHHVHVWTDRPIWPQGLDRPAKTDPVPDTLKWDQWLGTAPTRPFVNGVYHPFKWRGWIDFGTGAIGDMACHFFDPLFAAMDLTAPTIIWSEGPAPNGETYPVWSIIHFVMAPTAFTDPAGVRITWYDGGRKPPAELRSQYGIEGNYPKNGKLFIGEKGALYLSGGPVLYPREKFRDVKPPKLQPYNHYHEFVDVALGRKKHSGAPFDYSGPLTETALLGNVALRYPKEKLQWNAGAMTFTNKPQANRHLKRPYRAGWSVKGLDA